MRAVSVVSRHRLMLLFLKRDARLLSCPARVLHIAPEPGVHAVLSAAPSLESVTLDIEPRANVDVQADARDLPFESESFDAVLCSHVLEHILDDLDVAGEMARVLTEEGVALIQVPVDPSLATTYETVAPTPVDREREYGQDDHVRTYGQDIENRLSKVFRAVERIDYAAMFDASDRWRMGLVESSGRRGHDIYVCSPASAPETRGQPNM